MTSSSPISKNTPSHTDAASASHRTYRRKPVVIQFGRDGDLDSGGFKDVDHPLLGVVGAVCEQGFEPADHLG